MPWLQRFQKTPACPLAFVVGDFISPPGTKDFETTTPPPRGLTCGHALPFAGGTGHSRKESKRQVTNVTPVQIGMTIPATLKIHVGKRISSSEGVKIVFLG